VVVASANYPGAVEKGFQVELPPSMPDGCKLFHAGTAIKNKKLVTNGGRVFGATARGSTLAVARERAYGLARSVKFDGAWSRSDIAALGV
jgi:phosphoribosylamine--glycine ligase